MRKNLLALIFILIAVIAFYAVVRTIIWIKTPRFPELKFDIQKIKGFSVKSQKINIKFFKEDDKWKIKNNANGKVYVCDVDVMSRTLENIAEVKVMEIVSNKPDRFGEFRVDESSGLIIEIETTDGHNVSFIIGKESYDFEHSYFRIAGTDQVRLVEGFRRTSIEMDANSWRYSRILHIDRDGITRFEINYPDDKNRNLILSHIPGTTNQWVAENVLAGGKPKKADYTIVVKPLLYIISDFIHNGIMPSGTKWGGTFFSVKVTAKEGIFKIFIGDKFTVDKEIYYLAQREDDKETIYKVIYYKVENIIKESSDIK